MSIDIAIQKNKNAVALKGGMFTLTSIQLLDPDLAAISLQLEEKIKQAPHFFHHAPVILDFQKLPGVNIDLVGLIDLCRTKKMIPIGIRGAQNPLREEATAAGIALFPDEKILESGKNT